MYYPPVAFMGSFTVFIILNTCQELKPGSRWRQLRLGASLCFCCVWDIPMWTVGRTYALWDTPLWISAGDHEWYPRVFKRAEDTRQKSWSSPTAGGSSLSQSLPLPPAKDLPETRDRLKENATDVPVLTFYIFPWFYSSVPLSLPNNRETLKRCYSIENISSDIIRF